MQRRLTTPLVSVDDTGYVIGNRNLFKIIIGERNRFIVNNQ